MQRSRDTQEHTTDNEKIKEYQHFNSPLMEALVSDTYSEQQNRFTEGQILLVS